MAEEAALEGMPVPPGTVHVFGPFGRVQRRQLPSQARGMSGLDPGTRAGLEEALNALVPEASDHPDIVARSATRSKCSSNPLEVRIPDSTKKRGLKTERLNETISSGPPDTEQIRAYRALFYFYPPNFRPFGSSPLTGDGHSLDTIDDPAPTAMRQYADAVIHLIYFAGPSTLGL